MMPEGPPALPLWINGRAYLHVSKAFFDVADCSGKIVRRMPLCDAGIAVLAADTALAALPGWQSVPRRERVALVRKLADQLENYRGHFAGLLAEEGGYDVQEELQEALNNLRMETMPESDNGAQGVFALIALQEAGAFASACAALNALLAEGACIVLRPGTSTPSAFLALAELASRQGLPDGVFNLVFGDDAFAEALSALPQITRTLYRGKSRAGLDDRA